MKHLILLLFLLLFPYLLQGQVTITGTGGTGYYLQIANGDTLHLRGSTPFYNSYRIALQDAINFAGDNDIQVNIRSNINERVTAEWYTDDFIIEETVDTVFVEPDTLFIEDTEMLSMINDGIQQEQDSEVYVHTITGTAFADFIKFEWFCQDELIGTYSETFWNGEFSTEIPLDCQSNLRYKVTAESQLEPTRWKTATHEEVVGIDELFGIQDPDMGDLYHDEQFVLSQWSNTWGTLNFTTVDGDSTLQIDLPSRNVARIQWNEVPEHTNADFLVTEILDSSHSTGAHIALRSSAGIPKTSIETYIHVNGLGISIFKDGSWSNPISYPIDWEYGQSWTTEAQLRGDTLRVKAYQEGTPLEDQPDWNVYTDPLLSDIPAGFFSIGATGAGIYPIKEVAVVIYD